MKANYCCKRCDTISNKGPQLERILEIYNCKLNELVQYGYIHFLFNYHPLIQFIIMWPNKRGSGLNIFCKWIKLDGNFILYLIWLSRESAGILLPS